MAASFSLFSLFLIIIIKSVDLVLPLMFVVVLNVSYRCSLSSVPYLAVCSKSVHLLFFSLLFLFRFRFDSYCFVYMNFSVLLLIYIFLFCFFSFLSVRCVAIVLFDSLVLNQFCKPFLFFFCFSF